MGSERTFILVAAAAVALPSIASAQDRETNVTVIGAMQDREANVTVIGAMQDRETNVTVIGAAQDRETNVTVIGASNDRRRAAAENPADRNMRTIPVVYEDEPAPAPARTPAPAATPAG